MRRIAADPSSAGAHPHSGFIAASVEDLRTAVSTWVNIEIEEVVDARRIAEVADDIRAVSKMFVTLVFDYRILVTILGGRRPNEVGKSKHAEGAWGTYNGDDGNWKTSVPLALEHVGRILGTLLVDGLGFPAGAEEGFGLARRARDCVSKGLTAANTEKLFIDFFQRLARAADCMRTRRGAALPNLAALADVSERLKLDAVVDDQDNESRAATTALAVATSVATAIAESTLASAGYKRKAPAVAPTPLGAATPPGPLGTPGTPGPVGAPGTRLAKRAARQLKHQADKAAAAATAAPAAVTTPLQTLAAVAAAQATATALTTTAAAGAAASPATAIGTATPVAVGWTPTWGVPHPIANLCNKDDPNDAVAHFDYVCKQQGLAATMPCAFAELRAAGCRGAAGTPPCRKCVAQDARGAGRIAPPAGLVAKIKAACDPRTAGILVG